MENSVENFIQEQTHMLKVRCFLSWRSIARFKNESCTSQSDFLKRSERSQNQEVANVMERLQKEYARIDSS